MADNYYSDGKTLVITAPTGGLTGGSPRLVGSLMGIVEGDAAEGAQAVVAVTGAWTVAKVTGSGTAWTVGAPIYWDPVAGKFTITTATGRVLSGVAVAAAGDAAATGVLRLDGTVR